MKLNNKNEIGFFDDSEGNEILFINIFGSYSEIRDNGIFIFDDTKIDSTLTKLLKVLKKLKSISKKSKINFEYTIKFDGSRIDLITKNLSARWAAGIY